MDVSKASVIRIVFEAYVEFCWLADWQKKDYFWLVP